MQDDPGGNQPPAPNSAFTDFRGNTYPAERAAPSGVADAIPQQQSVPLPAVRSTYKDKSAYNIGKVLVWVGVVAVAVATLNGWGTIEGSSTISAIQETGVAALALMQSVGAIAVFMLPGMLLMYLNRPD